MRRIGCMHNCSSDIGELQKRPQKGISARNERTLFGGVCEIVTFKFPDPAEALVTALALKNFTKCQP